MYYKSNKTRDEELHLAEKAKGMGLDAKALTTQEVQALEPETEMDVSGAVHYKCDAHLYPNKLIEQLLTHLKKTGVVIRANSEVNNIITQGGTVKAVVTQRESYEADVVIMAGGSWLSKIAKMVNLKIPLMPGKGYSFTIDQPQRKLNIPAILCEARVAITPMNGHMRYGGTMEIGSVNDKINLNRVEGIVNSIHEYFPNMRLGVPDKKDVWYGFRPCSPDGMPYLGVTNKIKNLIIAGGHAMMGLSLGPASGKVVADLASGIQPEVNIKCFRVDRFS